MFPLARGLSKEWHWTINSAPFRNLDETQGIHAALLLPRSHSAMGRSPKRASSSQMKTHLRHLPLIVLAATLPIGGFNSRVCPSGYDCRQVPRYEKEEWSGQLCLLTIGGHVRAISEL